jgi:hypothetical protein
MSRSGIAVRPGHSPGALARLASGFIAARADPTGAATGHAGLLQEDRSRPGLGLGNDKPSSEFHLNAFVVLHQSWASLAPVLANTTLSMLH